MIVDAPAGDQTAAEGGLVLSYRQAVATAGSSTQGASAAESVEATTSGSVSAGSKRKTPDDDDEFQESMICISPKYRCSVIDVMKYLVKFFSFSFRL